MSRYRPTFDRSPTRGPSSYPREFDRLRPLAGEPSPRPQEQLATIGETLRRGEPVADRVFDQVYPGWVREKARLHWTPVATAMRVAQLLVDRPGARVLDIGAGVGKFCIVAAAMLGARVRGVEHRAHLVEIAESAAVRIGVEATFVRGTLLECNPSDVDGVYLYNPFAENVCSSDDQIDETVELSEARFRRDVAATEDFLRLAPLGTRVVTHCGFGGEMPREYVCVAQELRGGRLELWVKTDRLRPGVPSPVRAARLGTATISALRAPLVADEDGGR